MAVFRLSSHYEFSKPNDERALNLMNAAARSVVQSLTDIVFAYGVSDEYSFVLHKSTTLFERRAAKLTSTVVSTFTAAYVFRWSTFFGPTTVMDEQWLPTFDARVVLYPGVGELRDYLNWRQVDCHINNLYNTTFWALVQQGNLSSRQAHEELKGTVSGDKNEILLTRFGINYNDEPEIYKKGSVVYREYFLKGSREKTETSTSTSQSNHAVQTTASVATEEPPSKIQPTKVRETKQQVKQKARIVIQHLDIINDDFWEQRPWILGGKADRIAVSEDEAYKA